MRLIADEVDLFSGRFLTIFVMREAADRNHEDKGSCRCQPPRDTPLLRFNPALRLELRRVDYDNPAIVAIGDVIDDGGALRIIEGSFDEASEVFGLRVSEQQGHDDGTSAAGVSGSAKSMCSASAPCVSMSPMSLIATPAARRASRNVATRRSMRR